MKKSLPFVCFDTDIIFSIMERMYKQEKFDKVVLVSGDGDYKKLIDFLIEQNKLEKVLFPKQRYASSLYNSIGDWYPADLSDQDTRSLSSISKCNTLI